MVGDGEHAAELIRGILVLAYGLAHELISGRLVIKSVWLLNKILNGWVLGWFRLLFVRRWMVRKLFLNGTRETQRWFCDGRHKVKGRAWTTMNWPLGILPLSVGSELEAQAPHARLVLAWKKLDEATKLVASVPRRSIRSGGRFGCV